MKACTWYRFVGVMLAGFRRAAAPPLLSGRPLLCRILRRHRFDASARTPSTPVEVLRPEPEQGDWVSDAPGILSPEVRQQLNDRMDQLNADGRGQMAILLLENIRHSRSLPGTGA